MSWGTPWFSPSGRKGVELTGSTEDRLRLLLVPDEDTHFWGFEIRTYARILCTLAPCAYRNGALDED